MGNDGSSINKSYSLKLTLSGRDSNLATDDNLNEFIDTSRWKFCKMSNKPVRLPLVSDYKGHLFNKIAILEWLLASKEERSGTYSPEQMKQFDHIKSIHDIIELKNLEQSIGKEGNGGTEINNTHKSLTIKCKFGDDILGNNIKSITFIYLSVCGDVLPKASLMSSKSKRCPVCNKEFNQDDIITINPNTDNDIRKLRERYDNLTTNGKHHDSTTITRKNKKIKKRKNSIPMKRSTMENKRVKLK